MALFNTDPSLFKPLKSWWARLKERLTPAPNQRRWGDTNHHWGIFTYCPGKNSSFKKLFISLRSADEIHNENYKKFDHDGCHLMLGYNGYVLITELPNFINPVATKVYPKGWDAATVERMGRDWYMSYARREYGVFIDRTEVHVHYGAQTDCSNTDKSRVFFFPWQQTRFVRESYYHESGQLATQYYPKGKSETFEEGFRRRDQIKDRAPKFYFQVQDFDNTVVKVTAQICEAEYRYGEKGFKWVGWFRAAQIRRHLELNFECEVGPEKGSWKGGLMGVSVPTTPGEHPEITFTRWLEESRSKAERHLLNLQYLGRIQEDTYEYRTA